MRNAGESKIPGSDMQVLRGLHGHALLSNSVQHVSGKGGIKLERLDIKMS